MSQNNQLRLYTGHLWLVSGWGISRRCFDHLRISSAAVLLIQCVGAVVHRAVPSILAFLNWARSWHFAQAVTSALARNAISIPSGTGVHGLGTRAREEHERQEAKKNYYSGHRCHDQIRTRLSILVVEGLRRMCLNRWATFLCYLWTWSFLWHWGFRQKFEQVLRRTLKLKMERL